MYIVISGVHGAGKTTLARELSKKINGVYLTEAVDELVSPPQFGPKSNSKLASQLWHTRQILLKEQKMVDGSQKHISDRGWPDIYIYSRAVLEERDKDLFFSIIDHLPKRLPDIHFVVHIDRKILRERINNRKRDNLESWGEDDEEYALKINDAFVSFANDFKDLRPVYLIDVSNSIEDNVSKMLKIVNKYM